MSYRPRFIRIMTLHRTAAVNRPDIVSKRKIITSPGKFPSYSIYIYIYIGLYTRIRLDELYKKEPENIFIS